jgi:hypothetical protein
VPSPQVRTAVAAYIAAHWSRAPDIPINTTGEPPADGSSWLTVQYPVGIETHIGMAAVGNRTFREEGTIRLVFAGPRGEGQDQAEQWLEELRTLFRAAQFGGVTCRAPSPAVESDRNDNGPYWIISSSIPYYFDIFA